MIEIDLHLARPGFNLAASFRTNSRVLGLFGASGAGKSTIVTAIAGLVRPDRGTIRIDGRTLLDTGAGVDVPVNRRRVGVVFQEHRLFPHMTAERNLRYALERGAAAEREFERAVDVLELGGLLGRRPAEMSGGERQRVALGRAVLSSPAVLLLDEPLASLDGQLKTQLLAYLRRVRDEWRTPMVYVSHDLSEVLSLTDTLVVLDKGQVAGAGTYAQVVHEPRALAVLHERGMTNVIAARVVEQRRDEHAAVFEIGEGESSRRLTAPIAADVGPGTPARLIVRPVDIALSIGTVERVSIQNQLQGVVRRVSVHETGVMVEVEAGATWIVEVSRRAAQELSLEPERRVVCLIKSHAIRVA